MADSKRSRDYDWGDYSEKGDRIIAVLGWIVVLLITLYAGIYFGRQTRERARYAEREAPMEVSSVQREEPRSAPEQPAVVSIPEPVREPEQEDKPEPPPGEKPEVKPKPVVAVPVEPSPEPEPDKQPPAPPAAEAGPEEGFSVQVGAFGREGNAGRLESMLEEKGFTVRVIGPEGPKKLFKVRVGNYTTREAAEAAETILKDLVQQTLVVQNVPRR